MDMRVEVTNADVAAAKRAWQRAVDNGESEVRTRLLYDSLRRVINAQAQQMADDFRAKRAS
ncbi:hypothetical protein OMK64_14610 [Cellulomonas fimi]|uniref:hypothetical protein n=1 Tax=Cellulomonas fimi TaxID=1708 RepID=UPI00234DC67F|nr:hypothetical protein [Cellulomonas fimi]MDC7122764.1 hypothetical protein [Cellulomonas fimi]